MCVNVLSSIVRIFHKRITACVLRRVHAFALQQFEIFAVSFIFGQHFHAETIFAQMQPTLEKKLHLRRCEAIVSHPYVDVESNIKIFLHVY